MSTLHTPNFAYPYPDGTERVMDGDNAIGALANALDATMTTIGGILASASPALYRANGVLTLTTTDQIVPGCSVQLTPPVGVAQEVALIVGLFDVYGQTTGTGAVYGSIYVDGAARPGSMNVSLPGYPYRQTVPWITTAALPTGALHTIDLRARKAASGGLATIESSALGSVMIILRFRGALAAALADGLEPLPAELER